MLLRMRAHPLPEARTYAQLMLDELLKVIPSFLARVDRPDRGGAWTAYLHDTEAQTGDLVDRLFGAEPETPVADVTLVDWDPDGEDKVLAAICYPHTHLSEEQILDYYRKHQELFTVNRVVRPFEDAHDDVRAALIAEQQGQMIRDWMAGLRQRADIAVLYAPAVR
jgi:hypothetical protein